MKNRFLVLICLALFAVLLSACAPDADENGNYGNNSNPTQSISFASINLFGADGVVMQRANNSRDLGDLEEQNLYKIVDEDIQPVALYNESGSPVSFWGNPTSIIRLNDSYFVLTFKGPGNGLQPPYILVSVKEGILICLNHEGEYNHSYIETAISDKIINATEEGEYIYWIAPHNGNENFLDGSSMRRYKKGSDSSIETVKYTTDLQRYLLAVGKTSSGKDVGMMYSIPFTYCRPDGSNLEQIEYKGYIMTDGEEEVFFNFGLRIEFAFFFDDKFYLSYSDGIKSVDLEGNISEDLVFEDEYIMLCTDLVRVGDTCLLYDKNKRTSNVYLVQSDGVDGISVSTLTSGLDTVTEIQAGEDCYYFCGVKDNETVLKSCSTEGDFSLISSTDAFVVSSFYKSNDDYFTFVGKDDSDVPVRGFIDNEHGFQMIASSSEEYNYLTKIETNE